MLGVDSKYGIYKYLLLGFLIASPLHLFPNNSFLREISQEISCMSEVLQAYMHLTIQTCLNRIRLNKMKRSIKFSR